VRDDGFLWPSYEEYELTVRINGEDDRRDIDEIPIEEIAKGAAIVLMEGGAMNKDDLALETARLIGYERRGSRIEARIDEAVEILEEEVLLRRDNRLSIDPKRDPDTAILSRVYPSVTAAESNDETTTPDTSGDGDRPQNADDFFPFLDYDRSHWQVPCPYCGSKINNTRDAFVAHWDTKDGCKGPESTPPDEVRQIPRSEWDVIVEKVRSDDKDNRTDKTASDTETDGAESDARSEQTEVDLDIDNPDGSFSWLEFPEKGWKVPCPYCDENVFNSREAFENHWNDSDQCGAPSSIRIDETTVSAEDNEDPTRFDEETRSD
jgi:uncharacterized Zn-finger protein